jgi:chromosome segregation ATPase
LEAALSTSAGDEARDTLRLELLERELDDARAELERVRAAAPENKGEYARRLQDENEKLREERAKLDEEARELRSALHHWQARNGPLGMLGAILDVLWPRR